MGRLSHRRVERLGTEDRGEGTSCSHSGNAGGEFEGWKEDLGS